MTTGEGGMFVTNDQDLFEKVQILNAHGRKPHEPRQFWCSTIGFKYKISNIQAALGCAQLERIDELVKRKRDIFIDYHDRMNDSPVITMNPIPTEPGTAYGYWMPTAVFDKTSEFDRERLLAAFKKNKIDGRVFFYPLSSLPMFTPLPANVVSYDIYARAINLPSYHEMTTDDIQRVCTLIRTVINN